MLAPHHLYIGVVLTLLATATVWDDQDSDPWVVATGCLVTLFSFMWVWPFYPITGALGTLLGLLVSCAGFWRSRPLYSTCAPSAEKAQNCRHSRGECPKWRWRIGLAGVLIATDDVLEHAFGVPTPLDVFFKEVLVHVLA